MPKWVKVLALSGGLLINELITTLRNWTPLAWVVEIVSIGIGRVTRSVRTRFSLVVRGTRSVRTRFTLKTPEQK
jgi:hypothetical protein